MQLSRLLRRVATRASLVRVVAFASMHHFVKPSNHPTFLFSTVSKGVADGVMAFATSVAGAVSGAVGSTETGKRVKESKSGLKDVAAASIGAFGKVYVALETGTKRVFKEAGSVTTEYVRHR